MESINMKGRGDDATLTERQVKRLSARQVRVMRWFGLWWCCCLVAAAAAAAAAAAYDDHDDADASPVGPAEPRQRHVGREPLAAERRGATYQRQRRGREGSREGSNYSHGY